MNQAIFSVTTTHNIFLTSSTKPTFSTPNLLFNPCDRLAFNTHIPKPSRSLKNARTNATRAAANSFYATSETESFYNLLGISENVTIAEIKRAYKQFAKKYHPDVSPPDSRKEYTKRFIRVQEAYETLSDPKSRALYDRDLAAVLHTSFSTRKGFHFSKGFNEKSDWQDKWQTQLAELQRRSMNKDSRENISWGATIRRQNAHNKTNW